MNWLWVFARQRLLRRAPPGPLRTLLAEPWPEAASDANAAALLAVDFETTGLDPSSDALVSAAWVPIDSGRIELSSARHHVVRAPEGKLTGDSIRVHGVSHDRAARGVALADVLEELLEALRGRVLVAHHAPLDAAFLCEACRAVLGGALAWPCIDTLKLLEVQGLRRQQPVRAAELRLSAARARFALPSYPPHSALWDAVGAAELWLALAAAWSGTGKLPLGRVARVLPRGLRSWR